MRSLKLSEDLRPVTDLKAHGGELIQQVVDTGRPIVLSRHGRPVAVLISVDDYDEFQAFTDRRSLQRAVEKGERDISEGRVLDHEDVMMLLDRCAKDV